MKNLILTLIFALAASTISSAQKIEMKKEFGTYQFYQGEKKYKIYQLVELMKPNEQAYIQIKSAQSSYTLTSIIGFVGGCMVGWPLGTFLGGGTPNWEIAGIGTGLFIVSIPITKSYNRKLKLAIDTYNADLQSTSFWDKNKLNLTITGNGIGLAMDF